MKKRSWKGFNKGACLFFVLLLAGSVLLPECTIKFKPLERRPRYEAEIPHFRYEKETLQAQVHPIKDEKTYWIEKVTFPSSLQSNQVTGYLYHPKSQDNPPIILVIPILAGSYSFSKNVSEYLVKKGFSCLRFERIESPLDAEKGLQHTEMLLRHAIIDFRRVIDWLVERNGGRPSRIGVTGISMGAIAAALALEVEPRIGAAAIILGGGNIATILATSRESLVVRFQEGVMGAKGMTIEQFHEEATRLLAPVDPLTYASRVDPHRILMVNARFDWVIPYQNSKRLWEAMGRPFWIRLPTGHYTAVLYLWYIRYRIYIHFKKSFSMKK